jgi:aryl sulfotransferase
MCDSGAPPRRRRRRAPGRLARAIGLLLAWPVVLVLDLCGRWPRALTRMMNRAMGSFGPYQPGPHDVLVCSYFKSGTNWTMQIALQIAHRGNACFEHIHDLVAWPELPARFGTAIAVPIGDEMPWRKAPTGLRIIKTHLHFDQVPYREAARYICVVRDPKDMFVSSYHFVRNSMLGALMPSKQKWLRTFLSADAICGPWAEHLASCWQLRQRPNVLFLTYEEMKRDLPAAIRRIAALMGVDLSAAEFEAVMRQASFAHMQQIADRFEINRRTRTGAPPSTMIRRGEAGGSAELLSPEEQQRIDAHCRAELARLGCDFDYDTNYGVQAGAAGYAGVTAVAGRRAKTPKPRMPA